MNLKEKARQLKKDIPALFIALKHKETPAAAKILAAVTVGYALSPIDLIPDFIPVLGYLDDVILLPLLVVLTVKLIPKDLFEKCRTESENIWSEGKPKRWYYAVPIIFIWILIIFCIIKLFISL
ncbi:MAG: DUF1232 domain-containing protein [Oscillospiraceae bacterium]|nr:DUF1232 domain-containing protein [Oscillospiraceae bacterium]